MSPTNTDIVSLTALHFAAVVGHDHWRRTCPQPAHLTVHVHLAPSYLDAPAQTDNVADALHYGHLAHAVTRRVGVSTAGYGSARAFVDDVTDAVFRFASGADADEHRPSPTTRGAVRAVRAVLQLPKQILLAGGFEVELTTSASDWSAARSGSGVQAGAIVRVANLVLPVLIGVNDPERLAKQRIVAHLTFFEAPRTRTRTRTHTRIEATEGPEIDYPTVVEQVATDVHGATHFTLEKLVHGILRTAYRALDAHARASPGAPRIDAITVRCQKPSAVSFADASEVEMTRTREALRLAGDERSCWMISKC